MRDLLQADPSRANRYSISLEDLYINYSRNRITDETLDLLFQLAEEVNLKKQISNLFAGKNINNTESRPALHTALRSSGEGSLIVNGDDIFIEINEQLKKVENFISNISSGNITGFSGKTIDTLVNIGIGGSYHGPKLLCDALQTYNSKNLNVFFIANIDPVEINNVLSTVNPETTIFVISSKSFTTSETMTNAATAKNWLIKQGCSDINKHMVAVTANVVAAEKSGIPDDRIFRIWDWVGGRYSVWSATGLPVAAMTGMKNFREFLSGAEVMDKHFRNQPISENIPVILGLLDVWYVNFFNTETLAVIPYDSSLKFLPEYLGQLMMESNGKKTDRDNRNVAYNTSPVVWGGVGTNVQHSFMQLLHQGTHLVPVDFLIRMDSMEHDSLHHKLLLANCFAQSEALMNGNIDNESVKPGKKINGNNPSNTIIYEKLTPRILGMLLALYEHRTFVQAVIWNINPFDQWGVELGKKISENIRSSLDKTSNDMNLDVVTHELIKHYRKFRKKK